MNLESLGELHVVLMNLESLGKLHVVIVHFPLAFALGAVVADALWLITRRTFFRHAGAFLLIATIVTAPPVAFTGFQQAEARDYGGSMLELVEQHETMALVSIGIALGAGALRLVWHWRRKRALLVIYGLLMAALFVTVSFTGRIGGQIVHGRDHLKGLFASPAESSNSD